MVDLITFLPLHLFGINVNLEKILFLLTKKDDYLY